MKKEEAIRQSQADVIDLAHEDISEEASEEELLQAQAKFHCLPNSIQRPSQLLKKYILKTKYRKKILKDKPVKMGSCWLYPVKMDEKDGTRKNCSE
jgi:hypothetical protein